MKKLFYIGALSALLLAACGDAEQPIPEDKIIKQPTLSENAENTEEGNGENVEPESTIDTSVFEYAKSVDVTDVQETNKHITLQIDLADDAQPGMGTKNVLTQMYDFLQQEDITGAETVTFYVRVKEQKVAQLKTTVAKFEADPNKPMISTVLAASEIEMLSPEVKSFGETTGLW